jgi:hypothetical protein
MENHPKSYVQRAARYQSHALIEVRRFRRLSLFTHSGVLLDISQAGFKIEFVGEQTARIGDRLWLRVPLKPLGIIGREALLCRVEIRWFDAERHRIGGVFVNLERIQEHIIQQIIESIDTSENEPS